ncbi:hypothetical protein L6R49_01335 [Myxococcota bacterium]|nr:hypothetical protein [Myxococcota bacterium]
MLTGPLLTLWLIACDLPSGEAPTFYEGPALITDVATACDAERDERRIEVTTEGWTSGGMISMSLDGARFESHKLLSAEAAEDGTWDVLALTLDVLADPVEVVADASTAYLCDPTTEETLAWRLVVYDAFTREVSDCRVWGPELDWNAVAGYSTCDKRLEE